MAKQKGNIVTLGLWGKIGGLLVFRQVYGKTVVSKIPETPKGDKIEVSASDLPAGNITVEELNL
jgi:hypothetical protein